MNFVNEAAIAAIITALVSGVLAFLTQRYVARESRRAQENGDVWDRLEKLEGRVDRLERENFELNVLKLSLVSHIEQLYLWIRSSRDTPVPSLPYRLRDVVDRIHWDDPRNTE